jgi:hypothetical protein
MLTFVNDITWFLETEQKCATIKHHLSDVWNGISFDF